MLPKRGSEEGKPLYRSLVPEGGQKQPHGPRFFSAFEVPESGVTPNWGCCKAAPGRGQNRCSAESQGRLRPPKRPSFQLIGAAGGRLQRLAGIPGARHRTGLELRQGCGRNPRGLRSAAAARAGGGGTHPAPVGPGQGQ